MLNTVECFFQDEDGRKRACVLELQVPWGWGSVDEGKVLWAEMIGGVEGPSPSGQVYEFWVLTE